MKVLQINSTAGTGSTGRIAAEIGSEVMAAGGRSIIAFGRKATGSDSELIRIGSLTGQALHLMQSRLLDRHGFASAPDTRRFLKQLEALGPDLVHLHNLHGYYLHVGALFDFLKKSRLPVVWTLHDCWAFTGHCAFFDAVDCMKWTSRCSRCPHLKGYPGSWGRDNSRRNFQDKKALFTGLDRLVMVAPSRWLGAHIGSSFLRNYPVKVIPNGVDLGIFQTLDPGRIRKLYGLRGKKLILGVSNLWDPRKGLQDLIRLREDLDADHDLAIAGLSRKQLAMLPPGITGITQTDSPASLAELYSAADVFVNPTYVDNFPTVNLEALACGTPVVSYQTGGSPESMDHLTGRVVEKGDRAGLLHAVRAIMALDRDQLRKDCRERAVRLYDKRLMFKAYMELYQDLLPS